MKSAQEWLATFHDGSGLHVAEATVGITDIAAIQADALKQGAAYFRSLGAKRKEEGRDALFDADILADVLCASADRIIADNSKTPAKSC